MGASETSRNPKYFLAAANECSSTVYVCPRAACPCWLFSHLLRISRCPPDTLLSLNRRPHSRRRLLLQRGTGHVSQGEGRVAVQVK